MTTPNGARWQHEANQQHGSHRPLSAELTRRPDGRWIQVPQQHDFTRPGPPVDPATTELAVTKARATPIHAEWAAPDEFDQAFEEASSRFFEHDPGRRSTFDRQMGLEPGDDAFDETPMPGLDPHPQTRGSRGHVDETPFGHDHRAVDREADYRSQNGHPPDRPTDPGYPAGSGYEAVYGDAPIEADGPGVDDDELATGAAARRNAIEWAVVLVAAVLLALVLRALVLQAFYIPSPSMEDTLLIQDRVLVNKLSYRFGDVSRGDIVVFHRTDEEIAVAGPDQPRDVIKRVIALGGETIEIRESKVYINDQELLEPYLEPGLVMPDFGPLTVPEGYLFVMGDNRNLSSDSRGELGPIAEDRVVGRAFVLFWPVGRVTRL